jgi:hypothetical protein
MGGVGGGIREDSPYPDYAALLHWMFWQSEKLTLQLKKQSGRSQDNYKDSLEYRHIETNQK